MKALFNIKDISGIKDGMQFDRKVTFYDDKSGED